MPVSFRASTRAQPFDAPLPGQCSTAIGMTSGRPWTGQESVRPALLSDPDPQSPSLSGGGVSSVMCRTARDAGRSAPNSSSNGRR